MRFLSRNSAIIKQDRDFAQRKTLSGSGAVIWIRLPNTQRRDLLAWLDTVLPDILPAQECGEAVVEVV